MTYSRKAVNHRSGSVSGQKNQGRRGRQLPYRPLHPLLSFPNLHHDRVHIHILSAGSKLQGLMSSYAKRSKEALHNTSNPCRKSGCRGCYSPNRPDYQLHPPSLFRTYQQSPAKMRPSLPAKHWSSYHGLATYPYQR